MLHARFRSRTTNAQPGDPSCKLCKEGVPEDAALVCSVDLIMAMVNRIVTCI